MRPSSTLPAAILSALSVLLAAGLPGPLGGQAGGSPEPLPMIVVEEGRLLKIELEGGQVLMARLASPGPTWRIGLADGGVAEVPESAIRSVVPVRGTVRDARFWPGGLEAPGLLGPATVFRHAFLRPPGAEAGGGAMSPGARPRSVPPRPGLAVGTAVGLGPGRSAGVSAALDPDGRNRTVLLEGSARLLEAGPWTLEASGRAGFSLPGEVLDAAALGTLRSDVGADTQLHFSVGFPAIVEAGVVHRPFRRWAAVAEAAFAPGGAVGVATGVRYIGDVLSVEVGIASTHGPDHAIPGHSAAAHASRARPRTFPVVRVLHRR